MLPNENFELHCLSIGTALYSHITADYMGLKGYLGKFGEFSQRVEYAEINF